MGSGTAGRPVMFDLLQVVRMNALKRLSILSLLLLGYSTSALGVIPEPGMWWHEGEPGRGYYFDVQGSTIFFTAFAYEADGDPTFYSGSGDLTEVWGEVGGFGFPIFSALGYEPWHRVEIPLFSFSGGACFTCNHRTATGTQVGTLSMYFDTVSAAWMYISWNAGGSAWRRITRFNYHYVPPATGSLGTPPPVPDLLGDWVFVDVLDRSVPPWRFNFTRREQNPAVITRNTPPPWEVRFYDDARQARLVCHREPGGLDPNVPNSGCQLFVLDQSLFWARIQEDLGLDRIQAGYGAIPTVSEAYRGPGIILGHRVE